MGAIIYRPKNQKQLADAVNAAAKALREGKLVVFPTETVYGIGCNALDRDAVRRLYHAKQRPFDKPLLLHLYSIDQAKTLAHIDERALNLLSSFTPGPLSVIVTKRDTVPYEVTSGGETVGLRFPSNDLFLQLAKAANIPIAATSANISGFISAKDGKAAEELSDVADVILDGGTCEYSIESTIVSLTGTKPKLLRIGALDRQTIEEVIGTCD